jgi:DNA-binding NtrC family response regulator
MAEGGRRPVPPTVRDGRAGPRPAGNALFLLVIGEGVYENHPLPGEGEVLIGRGPGVDLDIDDASISRRHARVRVAAGPVLTIEDQGSANGTRVRERAIPAGEPVAIALGDVVELGSVMIIVQPRVVAARPRRVWSHDYFEGRLEDECARAGRQGGRFAVVRLHCEGAAAGTVEEAIAGCLRAGDVAGVYGPDEYELILLEGTAEDESPVEPLIARLRGRLAGPAITVRAGLARYPEDGRGPDALLDCAGARARGAAGPPPAADEDGMPQLHRLVERIARGTINVLILGETGAGKEVLAERVHRLSPRARWPFLRLNCAALSETLLESELFGHERGAFTGAVTAKQGLLETAEGGTVFLDEVGELPMSIQVKLLRVIEERQVLRVGGLKPRPIDVRFIAATNRDLELEVAHGAFRQDLFFRLNGVALVVPPLRDRVSEIEGLARLFASQAGRQLEQAIAPEIAPAALDLLLGYVWPGNIRELRNVMERAVLLSPDGRITPAHLPVEKMRATRAVPARPDTTPPPQPSAAPQQQPTGGLHDSGDDVDRLRQRIDELERDRILDALARCGGNQTKAAKMLGLPRRTLVSRLGKYGVPRPRKS